MPSLPAADADVSGPSSIPPSRIRGSPSSNQSASERPRLTWQCRYRLPLGVMSMRNALAHEPGSGQNSDELTTVGAFG